MIRMKTTLRSIKYWRIKKFLIFLCCMGISLSGIILINNDSLNTGILISGIVLYDAVTNSRLLFRKLYYEVFIEDLGSIIYIRKDKKEFFIPKNKITDVYVKEIHYGGRWLEVIGYQLIVMADQKYTFESLFGEQESQQKKAEMERLAQTIQGF